MSTCDYIQRRWPKRELEGADHYALMQSATADLKERGCTFFRISIKSVTKEIITEGWLVQPALDMQGELPL